MYGTGILGPDENCVRRQSETQFQQPVDKVFLGRVVLGGFRGSAEVTEDQSMALGRGKQERQGELWIATENIRQTTRHPFYQIPNQLLAEAEIDVYVEPLCRPFDAAHLGRPGIPRGCAFGC